MGDFDMVRAVDRRRLLLLAAASGTALGSMLLASGCAQQGDDPAMTARELTVSTAGVASPSAADTQLLDDTFRLNVARLSCELFRLCSTTDQAQGTDANTLISPLSLIFALALIQNGAQGSTLEQVAATSGCATEELNDVLAAYRGSLEDGAEEGAPTLHVANSIWLKDSSLEVEDAYLAACSDYLGASAFAAPFDASTVDDVNAWVSSHTADMIPKVIAKIDGSTKAMLVNALAFEGAWMDPIDDAFVEDGTFTNEDGTTTAASMMLTNEGLYLEDDVFQGFIRPYADGRFAFVGLLPKEGYALSAAIASLSGEGLLELLAPVSGAAAEVKLPRFALDYEAHVQDVLKSSGMVDAFDPEAADFSGIGVSEDGNLYIGDVLHKTFIEVDEAGTRAAAATVVTMEAGSSSGPEDVSLHEVVLDRPFAYMIVDRSCSVPVFMGAMRALPAEREE